MADSGSEDEQSPQITITLKSTAENHQLSIADNSTIGKVKKVLSEKINQPIEKICLIFSGKILKDHETLKTYNINDGMAIHMVIRAGTASPNVSASRPSAAASSTGGMASSTPSSTTSSTTTSAAAPTIPGMPPGMNMDTARRLMDSPFMQQMMNNPEILRNMIGGNEHIQSLIRQNPEIGHLLNDPEIIRQTMEMIRNPNMFNEMMRNHDQAIRNLQGVPGGEAALQRLYQDIQEPLLNSANSGTNPFASTNDASAESRSQRAGVENAEALPNPWGGGSGRTAAGNDNSASTDTTGAGAAGGLGGGLGGMNMANMMNNPALQSMMNSPEMQETMRSMMSNPEMMRTMMSPEMLQQARGLLGDGIGNTDDIARMAEQMSGLMGNPDVASSLFNPRVMEALNNIRTSIETIRTEAPGLFQQMFSGVLSSMNNMQNPGTTSATSQNTTTNTATDSAAGTGAAGAANPLLNPQLMNMLSSLSGNPAFGGGAGLGANIPPEERYRSQLDQLVGMGFSNREANIRALQDTNGDVNAAIDRLLNN